MQSQFPTTIMNIQKDEKILIVSTEEMTTNYIMKLLKSQNINDIDSYYIDERPIISIPDTLKEKVADKTLIINHFHGSDSLLDKEIQFRAKLLEHIFKHTGARLGHLICVSPEIIDRAVMDVDYSKMGQEIEELAECLSSAKHAILTTETGTHLEFELNGWNTPATPETGILPHAHTFCNYPSGEVCIVPTNINGKIVIDGCLNSIVCQDNAFELDINNGKIQKLPKTKLMIERFNGANRIPQGEIAVTELGFGLNKNAIFSGSRTEHEKIKGTFHLAAGTNTHIGG
ncbi:MAG: hypothetical protein KAR56_02095, partial [Thermoplasmata archaeon]|nr:hypothetical protein [Thermoplasmata archaeon]